MLALGSDHPQPEIKTLAIRGCLLLPSRACPMPGGWTMAGVAVAQRSRTGAVSVDKHHRRVCPFDVVVIGV